MSATNDFPAALARQALAADPLRPRYHLLPPANWINDPHGLIEWAGEFHLFYQYNPNGPFHGTIHWGHAVSDDLVHWRDLPPALAPGPQAYDQGGCWTGCLVLDNGRPTIFYTAVYPQSIAAAVSEDNLLTWQKVAQNPLIDGPPPSLRAQSGGHFRDPYVWKTGDGWEMIVASKAGDRGARILRYTSLDLFDWTFRGPFFAGDSRATQPFPQGAMWECPNWLDFGARQALILSVQDRQENHLHTAYFGGRLQGGSFMADGGDILVHGGTFYAPQVTRLADGRFLMFGWLPETREQEAVLEAGWSGTLSLPLEISLHTDGTLAVTPARELKTLREGRWQKRAVTLGANEHSLLPDVGGAAIEIAFTISAAAGSRAGLEILRSPDGREVTRILFDYQLGRVVVERERSSLDPRAASTVAAVPLILPEWEPTACRVFVDRSIVELFVDDRHYLATRVYPTRGDSRGIGVFCEAGAAAIEQLVVWQEETIWPAAS